MDECSVLVVEVGKGLVSCPRPATDYKESVNILNGKTTVVLVCDVHKEA